MGFCHDILDIQIVLGISLGCSKILFSSFLLPSSMPYQCCIYFNYDAYVNMLFFCLRIMQGSASEEPAKSSL